MEVKCIDNKSLDGYLKKNKIYLVNKVSDDCYEITDDKDEKTYYLKYRFVPVLQSDIVNIALEIAELVEKKDKDYNRAFAKTLQEYGLGTYFLRVEDKLNRLKTLLLNNKDAEVNKTVEDTLKDIAVYTLLMLKEMKK